MRLFLACLVALALLAAPFGGVGTAQASSPSCHQDGAGAPMEKAKACATHCVLQAGALRRAPVEAAPLEVNLVAVAPRLADDPRPPSGAGPPETPPPRA